MIRENGRTVRKISVSVTLSTTNLASADVELESGFLA